MAPVGKVPPVLTGGYVGSAKPVTLADLHGKIVLVEFMSLNSELYLREFPTIRAIHQRYKDRGFEIMTVCTDKVERPTLMEFVRTEGLNWILTHDRHHRAVGRWGVTSAPSRVLINPNGIVEKDQFSITDIEPEIRRLLNLPPLTSKP